MIGEWEFPEPNTTLDKPPEENKIVGHILNRLRDICYPDLPGSPKPMFPNFPLKAIVLGKPFVGKTSALKTVGLSKTIKVDYSMINSIIFFP